MNGAGADRHPQDAVGLNAPVYAAMKRRLTLELIGRHSLSIVSWGQSIRPDASRDAERAEAMASAAARALNPRLGQQHRHDPGRV